MLQQDLNQLPKYLRGGYEETVAAIIIWPQLGTGMTGIHTSIIVTKTSDDGENFCFLGESFCFDTKNTGVFHSFSPFS